LAGPIVGAFVYFFAADYLKEHAPNWDWLPGTLGDGPVASFMLGVLVIAFVFVAPQGVVGLFRRMGRKIALVVPEPVWVETMPPSESPPSEAIHEPYP